MNKRLRSDRKRLILFPMPNARTHPALLATDFPAAAAAAAGSHSHSPPANIIFNLAK
jgi:hypothetical protein